MSWVSTADLHIGSTIQGDLSIPTLGSDPWRENNGVLPRRLPDMPDLVRSGSGGDETVHPSSEGDVDVPVQHTLIAFNSSRVGKLDNGEDKSIVFPGDIRDHLETIDP